MPWTMKAQALMIGDELLDGRTQDTNGPWLGNYLGELGIALRGITLIGDNPEELSCALQEAWRRSELVITSGGLGPTKDDMTKQTLADFFQVPLEESPQAQALAKERHYHFIPRGFRPVPNPCGRAPGLALAREGKLLLAAPGVPRELTAMASQEFSPLIANIFGKRAHQRRITIRTQGVPEEDIFFKLCPDLWRQLEAIGQVASLPGMGGVDILVKFTGSEKEFADKLDEVRTLLAKTPLQPHIWQFGEEDLAALIVGLAREKNLSLALAESCTGGLAASLLTDIPDSGQVFCGSAVSYSEQAKEKFLGVSPKILRQYGAVSVEVAQEMARGTSRLFGATMALALTGAAGPGKCGSQGPGTLALAITGPRGTHGRIFHAQGKRKELKERFARQGLFALLAAIKEA